MNIEKTVSYSTRFVNPEFPGTLDIESQRNVPQSAVATPIKTHIDVQKSHPAVWNTNGNASAPGPMVPFVFKITDPKKSMFFPPSHF
jgi:hypothetical protein